MEQSTTIPSSLQKSWEDQALRENIPYTEFAEFIRMKQRQYKESLQTQHEQEEIFANAAKNKLSEYGNKIVLNCLPFLKLKEFASLQGSILRICKNYLQKSSKGKRIKTIFYGSLKAGITNSSRI